MKTPNRAFKLTAFTLTAPTRGLNSRDPLAATQAGYALTLDNFVISPDAVQVRAGCAPVIKLSGLIETLVPYVNGQMKKLFAASNGNLFLCDPAGAEKQLLKSELLNNRWQTIFYDGYQYFFNGQDVPQVYAPDGSFTEAQFTDSSQTQTRNLIGGCLYKNRLFMLAKDSLAFWYTKDAGAKQGEILKFDLSQMASLGGELILALPWTYANAGTAQESQLVLISSAGEVFIYAGDDPSDAQNWSLRGRYKIPRPQGRRSGICAGGDIFLACENGYYMLSNLLSTPTAQRSVAFSDTINNKISENAARFGIFGWDIALCAAQNMLVCNMPSRMGNEQYILNTQTGGWSHWTDINAAALAVLENDLFCAVGGDICRYGASENKEIRWKMELAYTNLGFSLVKQIKKILLFLQAYSSLKYTVLMSVDFKKTYAVYQASPEPSLAKWDEAKWDETKWGSEGKAFTDSVTPSMLPGRYFSFGIQGATSGQGVKFINAILFYKSGKVI